MKVRYRKLDKAEGPLIVMSNVKDAVYDEIVEVEMPDHEHRIGKVVQIDKDKVIIQVFQGISGISLSDVSVEFSGKPMEIPLSREILGRRFNGIAQPADGAGEIYSDKYYNINGRPMNPVARLYPRNYIQTGISAIDGLMTLIRGQKLPIFSGDGLPHNQLAAQIVRQAKISDEESGNFAVVFVAMGIKHDEANFFTKVFEEAGVMDRVVMFINLADDPVVERIITPRCALTAAEYLAFDCNMHVLVIMTDMTSYCEALREISSAREEVPSRKGYPGYLYSDLASLYERAGMLKSVKGSITQIPILTMPNDDITHPVPDLTGYITEGQIVLSRSLYQMGIYPPINVLPSLSRLMKDGIGAEYTREDHPDVSNQVFSAYSNVQEIRALAQVIGEDELSDTDAKYMEFGRKFEELFAKQGFEENRDINHTLDLMWKLLKILPEQELNRIDPSLIQKYLRK
ncbi:V-type ATP synthase beta chain 2 [Tepidanaerobacter acetatoxydans Re1]|uniref:V-type ATP synthase beta chain n=1 Tax=Tepidanaerobacter acetatoxydans (strain DSM 21804 / JCM 16047 / Re1) TaxID=1209989 RepID=F4LVD6_TEPAE|nr:V-type ATP synthase subunit B [Tepidanaerobacter acetatoxydans]AEE90711.1 V-type ATP synthase beta chain [Tepidanaerobacter acetatoxydans Re1]CCP25252.1 V-type ATP synthase beta chain 2 [Tepidanaerobacter acetatoxydans Re1]